MIAIVAMAGIRERLANARIPKGLEGAGISLIIAGIMSMAFMGFTGMLGLG
jgi:Na+-transporting NADH:ubiquinone oxidoreductase subunit E